MARVFICHRGPDKPLARKLAREIEAAGHQVWLDEREIRVGDSIVGKIDDGLARADYVVLGYSSHGDSSWTMAEWHSTLARELNGDRVKLLPVLLSGGEVPPILAGKKYADLVSDWDRGVAELLRAIR